MLLYEPRAFWSLARVDTSQPQPRPPFTVRLPANDFLNGEKYPITLTKALIAPINYTFSRFSNGDPLSAANFRNCGVAAVENPRVVISAPQRQYYLRNPGHSQVTTPRPSDTPNNPGSAFGTPDYASSLWGLTRWKFDKPMVIPRLGDLEFDLSSYTVPPGVAAPPIAAAQIHFEEHGGNLFGGNARQSERFLLNMYNNVAGGTPPFPPDGFGPAGPAYTQLATWPATQRFSAKRYAAENPSSDGSIPVTAFSVMIDQQAHDDTIEGSLLAPLPGSVLSPLSLRVAARARMRNGGTGSWWWRQGAPLALVCPSVTPAQVYDLPEPITLGPGDRLDLEVTAPGPVTIAGEEQPINSVYQIGVSLCGYASIEA
jgi:hypothetical protein